MYQIKPLDRQSACAICSWRYEPPYAVYNVSATAADIDKLIDFFVDPHNAYYSITDSQDNLVGFCCFGHDAQVPGGDYTAEALDLGVGLRPDLTGQGHGYDYVTSVLAFAQQTFPSVCYRVTIAEFNHRARRVWERAGFGVHQLFISSVSGRTFIIIDEGELKWMTA